MFVSAKISDEIQKNDVNLDRTKKTDVEEMGEPSGFPGGVKKGVDKRKTSAAFDNV